MSDFEREEIATTEIAALTAEIVGAYVGHHTVSSTALSDLIAAVGTGLAGLGQTPVEPKEEEPIPAVPIKRSVRPDTITCLVCGKTQTMLKRHLATRHQLDSDAYRAMFGLKADYPMVAPNYAAMRSEVAKKIGLGQKSSPKKKAPRKRAAKRPTSQKR